MSFISDESRTFRVDISDWFCLESKGLILDSEDRSAMIAGEGKAERKVGESRSANNGTLARRL